MFYLSDISGPIILDTYRVIADFIKTSKHELNLHTGDLVEIVEKNQNGEKSFKFGVMGSFELCVCGCNIYINYCFVFFPKLDDKDLILLNILPVIYPSKVSHQLQIWIY